jgi:hypothetical protein
MTQKPTTTTTTTTTNEPHQMWPQMRDPAHALAEALAMADGKLHLFWTGDHTREVFKSDAVQLIEMLRRRGWELKPT